MRRWTGGFLILALIAAIFGFGAVVTSATALMRLTFWIFGMLFLISLFLERLASGLAADSLNESEVAPVTARPPDREGRRAR